MLKVFCFAYVLLLLQECDKHRNHQDSGKIIAAGHNLAWIIEKLASRMIGKTTNRYLHFTKTASACSK